MRPAGPKRTDTRGRAWGSTEDPFICGRLRRRPAGVSTQSWSTIQSATVFGLALRSSAPRAQSTASNARRVRSGSNDGDSASSAGRRSTLPPPPRPRGLPARPGRAAARPSRADARTGPRARWRRCPCPFRRSPPSRRADPDVARVGDELQRPLRARAKTADAVFGDGLGRRQGFPAPPPRCRGPSPRRRPSFVVISHEATSWGDSGEKRTVGHLDRTVAAARPVERSRARTRSSTAVPRES